MILWANLDAESRWRREPLAPGRRTQVAGLATLMGVFGEVDDVVVLPDPTNVLPTDRALFAPRDYVVRPQGGLAPGTRGEDVLAWAAEGVPPRHGSDGSPISCVERVRGLARCSEAIAKHVNDRRLLASWREQGCVAGPPGWRWIETADDLARAAASTRAWVLKDRHGAAGADRVLATDRPQHARALASASMRLARHPGAMFEPWVARTRDLGATGWVDERGVGVLGVHEQLVPPSGRVGGIGVLPHGPDGTRDGPFVHDVAAAARQIGGLLQREGYRGPFGIDAYEGHAADGSGVAVTVSEVNARLTFGFVACALFERARTRGFRPRALRFGAAALDTLAPASLVLLRSEDGVHAHAWLEEQD